MNAPAEPNNHLIGASVKRKEDFRFLTGAGQYTDDVVQAHQSYAVFMPASSTSTRMRRVSIRVSWPYSRATTWLPTRSTACRAAG